MNAPNRNDSPGNASRREFLRFAGQTVAASALVGMAIPYCHAAEDSTIKLALVGCGGRGTGAVGNALVTTGGPDQALRHGRPVRGSPARES